MESPKILIVDDEKDLVSALVERLALRGFVVEGLTSGVDAARRIEEEDFGVLVLDVKMPGIDGLELMRDIRQRHPGLPVILFTGHNSLEDAKRGIEEGAFAYLLKPIDIQELVDKINDAASEKKASMP